MSDWIERDATRVWHGFTQMATFPLQEPVIVERAEGRELIDSQGKRYLDAISSLWVTTLGHRVPDLDAASDSVNSARSRTRRCSETATGRSSSCARRLPGWCRSTIRTSSLPRTAPRRWSRRSSAPLQYWRNIGLEQKSGFLALRDAYHGDTIGALSLGDGFHSEHFDRLRFPVLRADGYATRAGPRRPAA